MQTLNITDYISNEIDFSDSERLNTGMSNLDYSLSGFRRSGTYLVAGAEKSGKSSFLMHCVLNFLSQGRKVAIFDTELDSLQFYSRLLALETNRTVKEAESDKEGLDEIRKKYFNSLLRFDNSKLSKDGLFNFDLTIDLAQKSVKELGAEVLIFDNLTTYQSQDKDSKYMVLPACISKIITLTKSLKVWSFCVTHLRPSVKTSELPQKVGEYIKSKEPEKIFSDSITLIRKPSTADIYGGGQALSQISGTLIIWRPYQEFRDSELLKSICQVIISGFRDGSKANCYFYFSEEKINFLESSLNQLSPPVTSYYDED